MNNKYICIEGNIGAGKTTFTKRFAELSGATPIYEQFSENPFLKLFYKNPKQFAFPLEMSFLSERFQQLNTLFSKPEIFSQGYVADYTFSKTLLFAQLNLQPEEFELFKRFHGILQAQLPAPDLTVYLHTKLDYITENIINRGREMEQEIKANYLEKIADSYSKMYLHRTSKPILVVPYSKKEWDKTDSIIQQIIDFPSHIEEKRNLYPIIL